MSLGKYQGKLIKWNDARGFGFIQSQVLENNIFIHISVLKHIARKPMLGDMINFDVALVDGKERAINANIVGVTSLDSYGTGNEFNSRSNPSHQRQNYQQSARNNVFHTNRVQTKPSKLYRLSIALGVLVVFVIVDKLALIPNKPAYESQHYQDKAVIKSQQFSCDGRQYCREMKSREETEFFLNNCPNTKMDGDRDGVPCERQFSY
ncbi:excalibur calcium-binding domain-containing protein [Thalassotalea montiporae]